MYFSYVSLYGYIHQNCCYKSKSILSQINARGRLWYQNSQKLELFNYKAPSSVQNYNKFNFKSIADFVRVF